MVFMVFLVVFFAIIEFARVMNILVTINTVAASGARFSAREDPMLSVGPSQVESFVLQEVAVYPYLDPGNLVVDVDVNHQTTSLAYHSRVRLTYTVPPLFVPTDLFFTSGGLPISVSAMRTNETQERR